MPPFDNLNNSPHEGLNVYRVDCLLISKKLEFGVGKSTSVQIRYENYIKPHINIILKSGA